MEGSHDPPSPRAEGFEENPPLPRKDRKTCPSKNRKAALAKVEKDKLYAPVEAMNLVKECFSAKFDETVEVHCPPASTLVRPTSSCVAWFPLPNGSGKTVRVAVFAEGAQADAAREAGADIVGSDDPWADIQAGNINFDAAVATLNLMGKVGRLGKNSGPVA